MKTVKQAAEIPYYCMEFSEKIVMLPIMDTVAQTMKDKEDAQICLDLESANKVCQILSKMGCRTSQGESYEDIVKSCNSQKELHKIFLKYPGINRLQTIKILKEELNLRLKEAKDLVDSSPVEIDLAEYNVDKAKYSDILSSLQRSGATVYFLKEIRV